MTVPLLRWIEVDLAVLGRNVLAVRKILPAQTRFSAVVKSDAYGHGAVAVAKRALFCGADALAVTYLDEALELRRARVGAPLLVMGPVNVLEAPLAAKHRLSVMADNELLLKALSRAGAGGRPVAVHVKVNLGLARWGLPLEELRSFLTKVAKTPHVKLAGVFCHPGYMIGKNGSRVEEALERFLAATREHFAQAPGGGAGVEVHAADSSVLLDYPRYRLSRVRVGNLIYGINPTDKPLPLENPWKAIARLVHIEKLSPGQAVGYGGEFVAAQTMTVGTVPAGYAHGLTLEPASRFIHMKTGQNYWGIVKGVRCPFVGRVGMGHCLVDLSAVKAPAVGDEVRLPLRRTASFGWPKVYQG